MSDAGGSRTPGARPRTADRSRRSRTPTRARSKSRGPSRERKGNNEIKTEKDHGAGPDWAAADRSRGRSRDRSRGRSQSRGMSRDRKGNNEIKTEKDHGAGPDWPAADRSRGRSRDRSRGRSQSRGRSRDRKGNNEIKTAAEGDRSDGEISVKISSEALSCKICLEPLRPHIFKCEAGHVLCSVCTNMKKLREDGKFIFCDLCCKRTSYCRCVELEQIIDAIKVPCSNQTYGCNESIRYHEKKKHESECTHAPCYCPENDCTFLGATCCLLDHFSSVHGWSSTNFSYKKSLKVSVARDHRFTLLVGKDRSMFLLTNTLLEIGNALAMVCVRPYESGPNYSCNISAANSVVGGKTEGRLVFQKDPLVSSSSLSGGVQLGKFFLLVPPELADSSSGELTVHICVDKLGA